MAVLPATNEGAGAVIAVADACEPGRLPVGLSGQIASSVNHGRVKEVGA